MKALQATRATAGKRTLANRLSRVALLGLLALPASVWAQSPGSAAFRQGQELRRAGDCNAAIAKFNEAIGLEASNYRYYHMRGECEFKLRKYNEAIQSYRLALSKKSDFTQAHVRIASAYIRLKNYPGAIQALNSAYDTEQDQAKKITYKLTAIKLLLKQNRPQEAMAELNRLKSIAGEDPRVIAAEGDILAAQNNWTGAIAAYERTLARMANQPIEKTAKYMYALATAQFRAGQADAAKATAERFKTTPYFRRFNAMMAQSGAAFHVRVAQGYFRANLIDEAIEYANKAITAEPNNPAGYQMLASAQLRKNQTAQAIANMKKAAELQRDENKRNRTYNTIVSLQFRNGDYAGALNTANTILARTPNNAVVLGLKAQAEYQLGQFQAAIASAEKAIAADRTNAGRVAAYQFTQGLAAKRAGNIEMARTAFTSVARVNSPFRFAARIENEKLAAR